MASVLPAVDHGGERFPLEGPDPQGQTQTVLPIYIGSGLVIASQTAESREERGEARLQLESAIHPSSNCLKPVHSIFERDNFPPQNWKVLFEILPLTLRGWRKE